MIDEVINVSLTALNAFIFITCYYKSTYIHVGRHGSVKSEKRQNFGKSHILPQRQKSTGFFFVNKAALNEGTCDVKGLSKNVDFCL